MKKLAFFPLAIVFIAVLAVGCGISAKTKIGLSFSDFEIERWGRERDQMTRILKGSGYEVVVEEAGQDAELQNVQIRNLAAWGAKVIICVAEDGDSAAAVVDEIAGKGVKVIAYDRLIKSANIVAYVSFDNVDVGRNQAKGVIAVKDSGRFVLLGGSPTDNNARLLRKGQMEVLKLLIDSGKIMVVADTWVENWDSGNAKRLMEDILASSGGKIDAVIASNDSTALGALEAMKAAGLAGKTPISGQDATEAGCNSISRGELTLTILKDTRNLTPLACELAIKLAKGEKLSELQDIPLAELSGDVSLAGEVPCKFLQIFQVTAENMKKLVVDSGFQTYEGVYGDIKDAPAK